MNRSTENIGSSGDTILIFHGSFSTALKTTKVNNDRSFGAVSILMQLLKL